MKRRLCTGMVVLVGIVLICATAWCGVDFPQAMQGIVPPYPGATILASLNMGGGIQVIMESGDSMEQVINFYKESMGKEGWMTAGEMQQQEGRMVMFSKQNQMVQVVTGSSDNNKVAITINLTQQ